MLHTGQNICFGWSGEPQYASTSRITYNINMSLSKPFKSLSKLINLKKRKKKLSTKAPEYISKDLHRGTAMIVSMSSYTGGKKKRI
jgi:hypothetical protein